MTRIGHQNLTSARRTGVISYDRTLEFLVLYNNNPVPLYVRLGSPEIPNEFNYDIAVPPNYIMAISVNSNQFGFRLGSSNVVITQITGNSVIEATIDEQPPSLGGVPINNASLATADLLNGVPAFNGPTIYGPFNINQWGGMVVNVIPTATSGQGVIQVDVSADGVVFLPYQTWAFWANIPATILVPRVSQFCRITLNATTIAGEPAIAGNVSIRGSLAEIAIPSYTPQGTSITKTYALAASGSQQYQFVTTGYPAVSIAAIATAGTGASAAITLLVEASSDLVNWRQVTSRTQRMTTGITLYRALGNLDLFMRVTVFEVGGISAANGTVYLSIPRESDIGAILNTIQQSLGDTGAPSNTNQDIYHALAHIETWTGQASISVASIDGKETANNSSLASIDSKASTMISNLGSINTNVSPIPNALLRSSSPTINVFPSAGIAGPGVFEQVGAVLVAGWYISEAIAYILGSTLSPIGQYRISMATGTVIAAITIFYESQGFMSVANSGFECSAMNYTSNRTPGFLIPAAQNYLWVASTQPAGLHTYLTTLTQTPP